MDDNLKLLRDRGAQTIHNETHISREYVQAIIHETFDSLKSVQFMGFVSILEREYNIDLSDLREKGRAYFKEENEKLQKREQMFISSKKKTGNAKIYIILGVVLFGAFIYMSPVTEEFIKLDDTKINTVTKNLEILPTLKAKSIVEENNETKKILSGVVELNASREKEVVVEVVPEPEIVRTLKILPKRKVWAGYINIKTNQKHQKIFRKEFALDTSKDWLLLFGAGTVKLEVNEEKIQFSSQQNMRFKYVDGNFTKITVIEFKSLNKGSKW